MRTTIRALAALLLVIFTLAACNPSNGPGGGTASPATAHRPTHHPSTGSPGPVAPTSTPAPGSGPVVAAGHGWTASGLQGPTYPAGYCVSPKAADGHILPDPKCTPGATDSAVTQANIQTTICRSGYTPTVRPPVTLTGPAKTESAKEYGTTTAAGEYDHLVSLELGGASDTRNLWVEADGKIPNPKDSVENQLRTLVCGSQYGYNASIPRLHLADAQRLIAADWDTAVAQAKPLLSVFTDH